MSHDKFTNSNSMREGASVHSDQYLKHSDEPKSDMSRPQKSPGTDQSSATSSFHECKRFRRLASQLRSRLFILKLGQKKHIKYPLKSLILAGILSSAAGLALIMTTVYAAHPTVNLNTAGNFAVLAGSAVNDSNPSTITGDVGLWPASWGVAVLTCAEVTGDIYSVDATGPAPCVIENEPLLNLAQQHLTTAYNDAAGRTATADPGTELAGDTLTDGTYATGSGTFGINGTLTLDAEGNPDAVFIFNMTSTLVTGSSSTVALINGAQACNVFWRVGSSATLGTGSNFVGTIMADQSITDDGGSTVNGRFLARIAAVTLNNTTITAPTCAAATPDDDEGGDTGTPGTVLGTATPGLPNAGIGPDSNGIWGVLTLSAATVLAGAYLVRRHRTN